MDALTLTCNGCGATGSVADGWSQLTSSDVHAMRLCPTCSHVARSAIREHAASLDIASGALASVSVERHPDEDAVMALRARIADTVTADGQADGQPLVGRVIDAAHLPPGVKAPERVYVDPGTCKRHTWLGAHGDTISARSAAIAGIACIACGYVPTR